ncbi:polysaccharide pyruvyl transferase family protein [Burkholderia multivorans]|uniref:polysaccharide pyruvyl transferase family protein n=1 Tax=Burkholderia multivorans TaxID=87883 RepID=UPI001C24C98F|nr:polysaccharide pyruvyl transferase family protein [Burkholderia multivorans]MBU9232567.1 polysaccharide pyruvyl transferase family protein [Burkholderia multivorans]
MIKRVAIFGTNGGTLLSPHLVRGLNDIGENVGNSLFQYALTKKIANPKIFVTPQKITPEELRERADILVIPAANQINPAWDLGGWADFIEACNLPVVCIGLGAQSGKNETEVKNLKPGTIRFAKVLSERCNTIGVRGRFTANALEQLGISNVVITGCPSQTINLRASGKNIQSLLDSYTVIDSPKIAHVFGTMEPETRLAEKILSQLVLPHDHITVYQTDKKILNLVHSRKFLQEDDHIFFEWLRTNLHPSLKLEEYLKYIVDNGRVFSDARTWIDSMTRFDLVIGMRIHGAVAAIQSGTLGICVAFDSRTLELALTMGYPHVMVEDVEAAQSLTDILEKVVFDAARFDHLKVKNTEKIYEILRNGECLLEADRQSGD